MLDSSPSAGAQSSFDLVSPDKRIEVRVRTAQGIHYDVVFESREILHDCTMALDVDHTVLGKDVKVLSSKEAHVDAVLTPVVRQKFAKIHENYNELHIAVRRQFRRGLPSLQRRRGLPVRNLSARSSR